MLENMELNHSSENEMLITRIEGCLGVLENANEDGKDVKEEYENINLLKDEINLLIERLEIKRKEYLLLEHAALFKYLPRLARSLDLKEYQELMIGNVSSSDLEKNINARAQANIHISFEQIFELMFDEGKIADELLSFLIVNKFIHHNTTKEQFEAFLKFKSINDLDKINWIDSVNGRPTNKLITTLITNLFNYRNNGRGKFKQNGVGYSDIIVYYFMFKATPFRTGSLKVSISQILSGSEEVKNPRQLFLERKLKELYRI